MTGTALSLVRLSETRDWPGLPVDPAAQAPRLAVGARTQRVSLGDSEAVHYCVTAPAPAGINFGVGVAGFGALTQLLHRPPGGGARLCAPAAPGSVGAVRTLSSLQVNRRPAAAASGPGRPGDAVTAPAGDS